MKLRPTFLVNKVSGETVAVPVAGEFRGIVRTNGTSAFILECLKSETDFESILEKMLAEYDVPRERAEEDLKSIISQLRELDAIED